MFIHSKLLDKKKIFLIKATNIILTPKEPCILFIIKINILTDL